MLEDKSLSAETLNFFIFDTIKIFILVSVIIFIVAIARTFLQPNKIRSILSHENKYLGHIVASVLGIFTPFCTCSAIPMFLGFIESGVPLGVTFSFLVASPMINEVALIMLFGLFGAKVALIYIISGLCIAIFSGLVINLFNPGKLLNKTHSDELHSDVFSDVDFNWRRRLSYARDYVLGVLNGIWPYIIIGVGVGAWIHGYVPTDIIARYTGGNSWYAVPLAVLIGIPLYVGCAGAIPLVSVLTEKGVALGTALAFMMAVTALSLPEFVILKKIMRLRLILIFAGVVGTGIIFTGYLFNYILR
jgi:uncharacterized membrane protein YraQ (UPF0718 family)